MVRFANKQQGIHEEEGILELIKQFKQDNFLKFGSKGQSSKGKTVASTSEIPAQK